MYRPVSTDSAVKLDSNCSEQLHSVKERKFFFWWGGGYRGDHLIFRRTKGGITENFGHRGWGVAKVIKCY